MKDDKTSSRDRLSRVTTGLAEGVAKNQASRPSILNQAPVTMPGQLGAFRLDAQKYQRQIAELTEALERANQNTGACPIPLAKLVEVPGRRRKLSPEERADLKANLEHNPLAHPITVMELDGGQFEIISGNNRTDIYRELGRDDIMAYVMKATAVEAAVTAFYANLMQTELSAYEKYAGFKMLQETFPDMQQNEIAARAGKSKSFVSQLMAFDKLPAEALELIAQAPYKVGANAAYDLAKLAENGKSDAVVRAVRVIIEGTATQSEAVEAATQEPKTAESTATVKEEGAQANSKKTVIEPIKIRIGKATYCDMRRSKNVLNLRFKDPEEAAEVEEAVKQVLEARAEALKSKK